MRKGDVVPASPFELEVRRVAAREGIPAPEVVVSDRWPGPESLRAVRRAEDQGGPEHPAGDREGHHRLPVWRRHHLSELHVKEWTQAELDALFSKKMESGPDILLPIWHHISKDDVQQHSPLLAGLLALNTAVSTVKEIADSLIEAAHTEAL